MEKFLQILAKLPTWARGLCVALLSIVVAVVTFFLVSSCSMVRASLDGNGRLSTSVNQSVADSVNISVHFNR